MTALVTSDTLPEFLPLVNISISQIDEKLKHLEAIKKYIHNADPHIQPETPDAGKIAAGMTNFVEVFSGFEKLFGNCIQSLSNRNLTEPQVEELRLLELSIAHIRDAKTKANGLSKVANRVGSTYGDRRTLRANLYKDVTKLIHRLNEIMKLRVRYSRDTLDANQQETRTREKQILMGLYPGIAGLAKVIGTFAKQVEDNKIERNNLLIEVSNIQGNLSNYEGRFEATKKIFADDTHGVTICDALLAANKKSIYPAMNLLTDINSATTPRRLKNIFNVVIFHMRAFSHKYKKLVNQL
jgi:hypothetical protein